MRLAIVGCQNNGKSTVVNDFLRTWPNYKKSKESYRELIKLGKVKKINKKVTAKDQWQILNALNDDVKELRKSDKVICDRCALDNLVYSLWAVGKNRIKPEFIDKCIPLIHESMKHIDIIFYIPLDESIKMEQKENREIDKNYRKEIDNIFKAIQESQRKGTCNFFPKDDSPAIIEVSGTPEERIETIKVYLDATGDFRETPIFNPQEEDILKELLRQQKRLLEEEKGIKKLDFR